mmetsp:Transcript_84965/g.155858  ORF Transcript_84965/g.155858 Transcript_84965/m.155858 type:complete len:268 (-) Transcript_84965:706-1509(-)
MTVSSASGERLEIDCSSTSGSKSRFTSRPRRTSAFADGGACGATESTESIESIESIDPTVDRERLGPNTGDPRLHSDIAPSLLDRERTRTCKPPMSSLSCADQSSERARAGFGGFRFGLSDLRFLRISLGTGVSLPGKPTTSLAGEADARLRGVSATARGVSSCWLSASTDAGEIHRRGLANSPVEASTTEVAGAASTTTGFASISARSALMSRGSSDLACFVTATCGTHCSCLIWTHERKVRTLALHTGHASCTLSQSLMQEMWKV